MHSLGIVHRDLKPENVMVLYLISEVSYNESEQKIETVKIIDFGFSNYLTAFSSMTADGKWWLYAEVLAGTPNYISPELLRGEDINYKSDNFAIGSILYFM
jgi:serine/threonine-protein kinase